MSERALGAATPDPSGDAGGKLAGARADITRHSGNQFRGPAAHRLQPLVAGELAPEFGVAAISQTAPMPIRAKGSGLDRIIFKAAVEPVIAANSILQHVGFLLHEMARR